MSLILVYFEVPDMPTQLRIPETIAAFHVEGRLPSDRASHPALALTDGVASDRFFEFGNGARGRAGAKLRTSLIEFIEMRHGGGSRVFLKLLLPKGRVKKVPFDLCAPKICTLGRLRTSLRTLRPGEIMEVTGTVRG